MNLAGVNKGVVALILALLFGAGGYLWWTFMYKPAVELRTAAVQAAETAEQTLQQAQTELDAAKQAVEDARTESAKPDDSVARLAKSRTAIPDKKLLDDSAIVLVELAQRSGVQTKFEAGSDKREPMDVQSSAGGSTLEGAVPVDLTFEAAGTYAQMMQFMQNVEATVDVDDGKLYTRGRLFNVVKLEIGAPTDDDSAGGGGSDIGPGAAQVDDNAFVLGPNDILFTVTVRMYMSTTANAEAVGAVTPDPAAAATTPGGAPDAAAAGGAPDAAAAGGAPAAGAPTTPSDPAVSGSTAPAATTTPATTTGGGI